MSTLLAGSTLKHQSKLTPCVILLNKDYLIIDANEPALTDFLKIPKKDILHQSLLDLLVGKDFDVLSLKDALQYSEILSSCEIKVCHSQKNIKYDMTISCLNLENKYFSIILKKSVNRSYNNLKAYMDAIINNLPGAVYWKDTQGHYLGCNRHVAQMAGYDNVEDMIGKTDYDLCWNEFADKWQTLDQEVIEKGKTIYSEEKAKLADGRIITELTYKTPLRDEFGQVVGIIGTSLDITEKKELEQKLIEAKEKAEKAQKAEDELKKTQYQLEGAKLISGSIAHEIRTPLATIKSGIYGIETTFLKLLEINRYAVENNLEVETITENEIASAKKAIHSINKKVEQSNVIINMLLTKLQSIHFEFSTNHICSALKCIDSAIDEFKAPDNMINTLNLKNDKDFKFKGNSTLVIHVIMNLLKNAIFYILKAGKGEITIWLEQHNEFNEIHFKDTGAGISPHVLPRIFDSFFTTESSTGTGVGLAFSKMVMQSHQGKIDCLSEQGEYTEFILSFPKLDKEQA